MVVDVVGLRAPVFLHAHPDDETLSTGGLLALLARRGAHVTLVTATRGERGDVVPGPLQALQGTDQLELYRAGELRRALDALGTPACPITHAYLGEPPARAAGLAPTRYTDSGMVWGDDGMPHAVPDCPPTALTHACLDAEVADLVAALTWAGADALVSYGTLGGYGHPDHLRCAEMAARAARLAGIACIAALSDAELDALGGTQRAQVQQIDALPVAGAVEAALRAHASQLTVLEAPSDAVPHRAISIEHCGGQREDRRLAEYYLLR